MDIRNELSSAVSRILQSPYVPCLKKLHDLLQDVDIRTVQNWADSNACQIQGLANAVLDGLQSWPFVLHILRVLSRISSFRAAVIQQKPMLLDTLLTEATRSEQGFLKYAAVCTSLLCADLPVPVPAAVAPFLQKILEKAVQAPSAENIRPIHSILSGVGYGFLDILPLETVNRFQLQLIQILKGLEVEEHSANLICLAILANLAARKITDSTASDASSPPDATSTRNQDVFELNDRYHAARLFFTFKRATKTLDLVVLKVILSCSKVCSLRHDEVMESLKLSEEIVDAVSSGERSSWMDRNAAKVKKLSDKIVHHDLDRDTKCAALGFVASLTEGRELPEALIVASENLLCKSSTYALSQRSSQRFMLLLDERSVRARLLSYLHAASAECLPSSVSLTIIATAENCILNLDAAAQTSSSLRQMILLSISAKDVKEPLQQFVKSRPSTPNTGEGHNGLDVCPRVYAEARRKLHESICDLLLKTAFHAPAGGAHLDAKMGLALLDKRNTMSSTVSPCEYYGLSLSSVMAPTSLLEAVSTPQTLTSSHDWRTRLFKELTRDAKYQYEAIVKMVGDICQDLERRCNEAERPFRAEQVINNDLKFELQTSRARLIELESQVLERTQVLEGLEVERRHLQGQVQAFEQRVQLLGSRLAELEKESYEAKKEAESAAEAACETAKQQELTHLACMTGKDEMLEEQGVKLADLEARASGLESELSILHLQEVHSKENIERLEEMVNTRNQAIEQAKATTASREADVDRLVVLEATLTSENQRLKNESSQAQQTLDERNSTVSDLESQILSSSKDVSDLQKEHELYLSAKSAEILRLEESQKATVEKLNADLYETKEKAALKLRQKELQITDLEKKVHQLRRDREEQTKELAEAQELKAKLMTVMGTVRPIQMPSNQPCPRTLNHSEYDQDVQEIDKALALREAGVYPTHSFESSTSSRNGPAPKRNKTRRSIDSPLTHPMRAGRRVSRGKSLSNTAVRTKHPLKDLGLNEQNAVPWSPIQSQRQMGRGRSQDQCAGVPTVVSKEHYVYNSEEDLGESSFGSDVFNTTNQQQLNGPETGYSNDDTTVDF